MGSRDGNYFKSSDRTVLTSQKSYLVWKHQKQESKLVTPKTSRNPYFTIRNIKSEVKQIVGN